jgi:hypothetical protein
MKMDAMTMGAVGFAAFAAWYVLKKPKATASTGSDAAFAAATAQRRTVGENLYQNNLYFAENLPAMGGGQGLIPSTGFWAT